MKVLIVYDFSGPKYHRLILPMSLMEGVETRVVSNITEEDAEWCDILFYNRIVAGTSLATICQLRKRYGFKIVVDFDDHWRLSPDHYLYQIYNNTRASELMSINISEADAITVTHERLADEVFSLNRNVHILPNAIPRYGQFITERERCEDIRIFWSGGITHKKDIELLRNPMNRIASLNGIKMVMSGYNKKSTEYHAMASAFTNGGKIKSMLIDGVSVDKYYSHYAHCDIALVPLCDTVFNSYKSNLKLLEAANASCPVIVSHVNPYLGFPDDLVNYVHSKKDWYLNIKKLIADKQLRHEQGIALHNYCRQHFNFEKINEQRKQLFYAIAGEQKEVRELQEAN